MGPIGCPETSARNYHYTPRNSPEERSSHPDVFTAGRYTLSAFIDPVNSQTVTRQLHFYNSWYYEKLLQNWSSWTRLFTQFVHTMQILQGAGEEITSFTQRDLFLLLTYLLHVAESFLRS